jgi:hypothetical protein
MIRGAMIALVLAGTLVASPPTAWAAPVQNVRVPLSFTSFTGCPEADGEPVQFEGFMHIANNFTVDAAGGFREHFHANVLLKGVGLVTGDRYVSTSVSNLGELHVSSQQRSIVVAIERAHQIRAGEPTPDDDQSVRLTMSPGGHFVEHEECR